METVEQQVTLRVNKLFSQNYSPEVIFMQLYRREDFEKTAIVRALIPKIGAKETAKMLIDGLYVTTFYKVLDELVKAGLGIDELVDMLNNHMLYDARQAQQLIKAGAKPDVLVDKVENLVFHGYIDFFVRIGVSPEKLLEKTTYIDFSNGKWSIECLKNGKVDMDKLVMKLRIWDVFKWHDELLKNGVHIHAIAERMLQENLQDTATSLISSQYKETIDSLIERMNEEDAKVCKEKYSVIT